MISAIYTRQSLDKKESVSIEAQIDKCVLLCNYKQKEYETYIDKGFSGKNIDRPAFEKMLADIKSGIIDEVIVYRVDRISRNLNDFTSMISEFEKHNVSFASATESFDTSTPMGRAMVYLLIVFAQLERETIVERVKDNTAYRALLGKWTGGITPFGYNSVGNSILEINSEESEIIKIIFEKYLEIEGSARNVTKYLISKKYRSKNDKEFSIKVVSVILQNVRYATNTKAIYEYFSLNKPEIILQNSENEFDGTKGMCTFHNKYVVIGTHKGIIDGSTWVKAQMKLNSNKYRANRQGKSKMSWLAGLVFCGYCGLPFYCHWSASGWGKNKDRRYYLRCRGVLELGEKKCKSIGYRLELLEDEIQKTILKQITDKKFLSSFISDYKTNNKSSSEMLLLRKELLNSKIKKHEKEVNSLIDNLKIMSNNIVIKEIEGKISETIENINKFKKDLLTVQVEIDSCNNYNINKDFILDRLKTFPMLFNNSQSEEKRILVRGIINKIYVKSLDSIDIEYIS